MREPLFVLCPPRSYSSIVCGMIGQHPDCYSLPELNLFLGDTLGEGLDSHPLLNRFMGRDGLLRALAQLHDGQQTDQTIRRARAWIATHSAWPVRKVFDHIQELVGDKILVEKSPIFAKDRRYLERMLSVFPRASLLHLTRHPRGMGESYIKLRAGNDTIRQAAEIFGARDPEWIWHETHALIASIAGELPLGQYMRLKGEALLADPENYLLQVCQWLDIRTDAEAIAAMMHPEQSPYAHPGPPEAPRGNDPNFLSNPAIDRARLAGLDVPRLDGEVNWRPGEMFTTETRRLAKQLGYQ